MRIYCVEYIYHHNLQAVKDELRPAHRAFMRRLSDDGTLLATGKLVSFSHEGSLSVVRARNAQQALEELSEDPYIEGGLVKDRVAREWKPVAGKLSFGDLNPKEQSVPWQ
ncbi:MAG: YciI family protein [Actinomycetaceae bacterium]|nr:YciI family protein [Actinomycetaceae bacterium]